MALKNLEAYKSLQLLTFTESTL